ncbi:MAG: response regulator [Armatimonadota bacterium]|nr:response regulator [Armatimonadota bacterium]
MGKILVVDDEDDVRLSLERRLKREGHTVDTAGSQDEAIERISSVEVPYDVVLADMLMEASHSGVEVLKATLARDIFTEVVILTAYGNVSNAVECMKLGAFDYVEKNIPNVDVYNLICLKIEQALERRRSSLTTLRKLEQFSKIRNPEAPTFDIEEGM